LCKILFETATISDVNSLHNVLDELQQRNSDIVHSLSHQVTYIKKLDATAEINANAIANLSNIIKHNMIQAHDKFQRITRDVMWLNLMLHGQSELHTVVREFTLLQLVQQIDELFDAIQCVIQGNLPIRLVSPTVLQNILKNVTLHLPDG
jgi:hypothetical protein